MTQPAYYFLRKEVSDAPEKLCEAGGQELGWCYTSGRQPSVQQLLLSEAPVETRLTSRSLPHTFSVGVMGHWSVKWDITLVCNMKCRHCYNAGRRYGAADLPLEKVKKVVDELAPHAAQVSLLGGEPTCRPDLYHILKYMKRKGLRVSVVTNGLNIEQLKQALDYCQSVVVSIDGYDEESYGTVRPAEYFATVVKNAKQLARSIRVEINCVVHRGNFRSLDRMIDLALDIGAKELDLLALVEFGAAQGAGLAINECEKVEALITLGEKLRQQEVKGLDILPRFVYPLVVECINIRYDYQIPLAPSPCVAATRGVSINWHGEVFPCEMISQLWPPPQEGVNSLLERKWVDICTSDQFRKVFFFQAAADTHKEWKPCSQCQYRETLDRFPCPVTSEGDLLITTAKVESCAMALKLLEVELCAEVLWKDGTVFNPIKGPPMSLNATAREIFDHLRDHGDPVRVVEEMTRAHPEVSAGKVMEDVIQYCGVGEAWHLQVQKSSDSLEAGLLDTGRRSYSSPP